MVEIINAKMKINKIIMLLLVGMFCISFTSAFLNIKTYDNSKGNYGEIAIKDWLGLGNSLATYKLNEVSNSVIDAYAKGSATLYSDGQLFTGKEFKTESERTIDLSYSQVFILVEEEYVVLQPIYDGETCKKLTDEFGKSYDKCIPTLKEWIKDIRTRQVWKEYNYEILPKGDYEWKIEVHKPANLKTDFVLTTGFGDFKTNEWSWWNITFGSKKKISIVENQGTNYKNYTILVNIPYVSGMQTNFDDLRFLDGGETQELKYWIENYTSSGSANVWIKIPELNATSTTYAYMYYGNPLITNLSNQYTAFLFYDDFNSNYTYNWTTPEGSGGTISQTAGVLKVGTGGATINTITTSKNWSDDTGGMVEVKARTYMATDGCIGFASNLVTGSGSDCDIEGGTQKRNATYVAYIAGAGTNRIYNFIKGSETHTGIGGYAPSDWTIYDVIKNGTDGTYVKENGTLLGSQTTNIPTNSMGIIILARSGFIVYTDWVMMKRYAFVEPTVTFGGVINLGGTLTTTLLTPVNNENISISSYQFNASCSPTNVTLTNATFYLWREGILQEEIFNTTSGTSNLNVSFIGNTFSGNYTWNVLCEGLNLSSDAINSYAPSNYSFQSNNSIPPPLTTILLTPANNTNINAFTYQFNASCSPLNVTLKNATLYLWQNSILKQTQFNVLSGTNNLNTSFIGTYLTGNYTWNVLCEGLNLSLNSVSALANSDYYFYNNFSAVNVNSQTYINPIIGNVANQINTSFVLAFTPDAIIFTYNNTVSIPSVSVIGGIYYLSSNVVSPLVSSTSNISFYYNFSVAGNIYNSAISTQTVTNLNLSSNCTGNNYTFMNISNYDEETLNSMSGVVEYALTLQNLNNQISAIYGNASGTNLNICSNQNLSGSYINYNLQLRYYDVNNNYFYKTYNIQNSPISNIPIYINLYYLNRTFGSQFQISYADFNYLTYPGAIMQIQRQYLNTNSYLVVEIPQLDNNGRAVGSFNTNNIRYKIIVINNGVILDTFNDVFPVCQNIVLGQCDLNLRGAQHQQPSTVNDFTYTLVKTNNTLVLTYIIPSGTPRGITFLTNQDSQFLNNISYCNTTVFASGGTITCGYNNTAGDSIISTEIINTDGTLLFGSVQVAEDLSGFFLGNNYFIAFILLLSLGLMFVSSGFMLVVVAVVGVIYIGLIFLINKTSITTIASSLGWLIISAVIIIYKISQKEDRT